MISDYLIPIHSTIFKEPLATITASPITLIEMFPEVLLFAANAMMVGGHMVVPSIQPWMIPWIEGSANGDPRWGGKITSASPSYFWLEGDLGPDTTGLSFDVQGINLSGDDYIACFINSALVYSLPASEITNGEWVNAGFVDLSEYKDAPVNIAIGIFTDTDDRQALFKNLEFYKKNYLADAILALQTVSGFDTSITVNVEADINGNGKIGLEEAVFALQKEVGSR